MDRLNYELQKRVIIPSFYSIIGTTIVKVIIATIAITTIIKEMILY